MFRYIIVAGALAGALSLGPPAAAGPAAWSPPRTAEGRPDFTGVWTNASVTKLTRPPGSKLVLTAAEAKALAENDGLVRNLDADATPTDPGEGAPPVGGVIGGNNMFWLDPGRTLAQVKGQYRGSWIVDPPDGQLPFSADGRALVAKAQVFARGADRPDNPEALQPWDRCLIGSRGSGGPGMLNNIYNSNYQIVQGPRSIVIVVEMIHEARTIPILPGKAAAQAAHGPAALKRWLGDSTAWWEGDTLAVETLYVNPQQGRAGPLFLSDQGRVTERFTRVSPTQVFYAFEVDDPVYYSRPWRAEQTLTARRDRIYEYACHEGNYAMSGILRGARTQDGAP